MQVAPLIGTGVIHGDIQAAKALDSLADEIAHVVLTAHIGAHELSSAPRARSSVTSALLGIVPSTGNYDARTFLSEREGGRAPDAGQRARDKYDWVFRCFVLWVIDLGRVGDRYQSSSLRGVGIRKRNTL